MSSGSSKGALGTLVAGVFLYRSCSECVAQCERFNTGFNSLLLLPPAEGELERLLTRNECMSSALMLCVWIQTAIFHFDVYAVKVN